MSSGIEVSERNHVNTLLLNASTAQTTQLPPLLPPNMLNVENNEEVSVFSRFAALKKKFSDAHTNQLKIKLLYGGDVSVALNDNSLHLENVRDLKQYLCEGTGGMSADDILLVCGGKQLQDSVLLEKLMETQHSTSSNLFALVKSTAKSTVTLPINCKYTAPSSSGAGCAIATAQQHTQTINTQITIPASARVFYLQQQLYKQKLVPLKPSCQRLLLGTRTLADECEYVGNYLLAAANTHALSAAKRRKRNNSSNNNNNNNKVQAGPVLHVTQTVDRSHEVHVSLLMGDRKTSDFALDFPIGEPISKLQDALVKRRMCPRKFGALDFFLVPSSSTTTTSGTSGQQPAGGLRFNAKEEILLERTKTLLDYGVTNTVKAVTIRCALIVDAAPVMPQTMSIPLPNGGGTIHITAVPDRSQQQQQVQSQQQQQQALMSMLLAAAVSQAASTSTPAPSTESSASETTSATTQQQQQQQLPDQAQITNMAHLLTHMSSIYHLTKLIHGDGNTTEPSTPTTPATPATPVAARAAPAVVPAVPAAQKVVATAVKPIMAAAAPVEVINKKRTVSADAKPAAIALSKPANTNTSKKNESGGLFSGMKKGFLFAADESKKKPKNK